MRIAIGSDHAGYAAKQTLTAYLKQLGHSVIDKGCDSPESCDYPDYAYAVSQEVVNKNADAGVLICGTGIGMSITANKVEGIRAALCTSEAHAELSRQHNNANILCLGGRLQTETDRENIARVFLETAFEGGRHSRRVEKIHDLTGR